jgi:hypothetical protein
MNETKCEARARGRRENEGVTILRRHGAQEDEDESRSPNAVDETRRSSGKAFNTPRSTPDLSLEGIGWVERLGEGKASRGGANGDEGVRGEGGCGRKTAQGTSPRV